MLDNEVLHMSPGEALLDAPIADMIQKLALGIAEAQLRLDQVGVEVATLLSETKVEFKDENGQPTTKSLLELGFVPTFYHFTETEIDVKLTIQLKVSEGLNVKGAASIGEEPGAENRAVAFGASINVEYSRKYDFDMSGSSSVKTKLVAVPPPSVFIDTIKAHARAAAP